jgi:hypothetical protein
LSWARRRRSSSPGVTGPTITPRSSASMSTVQGRIRSPMRPRPIKVTKRSSQNAAEITARSGKKEKKFRPRWAQYDDGPQQRGEQKEGSGQTHGRRPTTTSRDLHVGSGGRVAGTLRSVFMEESSFDGGAVWTIPGPARTLPSSTMSSVSCGDPHYLDGTTGCDRRGRAGLWGLRHVDAPFGRLPSCRAPADQAARYR